MMDTQKENISLMANSTLCNEHIAQFFYRKWQDENLKQYRIRVPK